MRFFVPLLACAAFSLAACTADDPIPDGDPNSQVRGDRFGENHYDTIAVGPNNQKFWAKALMTGYVHPTWGDVPGKVEPLPRNSGCKFPPMKAGAKPALVGVSSPQIKSTIYSIEPENVRKRAETHLAIWARDGKEPAMWRSATDDDVFKVANVVVTDTSAPVHLVLSGGNKVLWNIHAAEGVTFSGVNIVDQTNLAAIANLPDGVPVTAMTGALTKNCNALAFRAPNANWSTVERAKTRTDEMTQGIVTSRQTYYANFNGWFKSNYGVGSESVVVSAEQGTNFLVGPAPAPDKRVAYKSLRGSNVKITSGGTLVFGDVKVAYANKNEELIRAQIEKVSGGSVARLTK